jgi:MPBQ/MSBQ methyltransferase
MSGDVARLFDAMADSYDRLEPWYEHLYDVLHDMLRVELGAQAGRGRRGSIRPPGDPGSRADGGPGADGGRRRALDAGCGTGLQTALLEAMGYDTHGVDLSAGLLAKARPKLARAQLLRGDVQALPYDDGSFDTVVCCGSTLSFVDDPPAAVAEMGRVLVPGGALALECEHKWSLDLAWALVSSVTRDSLRYGVTPPEVWRQLARPLGQGFVLRYPVIPTTGVERRPGEPATPEWMRLRLFTMAEIRPLLERSGLVIVRTRGIHAITNLIPSTLLHRQRLGRPLGALFAALRALDRTLGGLAPVRAIANSVVVLARKRGPPARPRRGSAPSGPR